VGLEIIEGRYLRDVLDQPLALKDTLAGLERPAGLVELADRLAGGEFLRIVLTGMGSSFHGLHPVHLQLIGSGFNSIMVETSELVQYQTRLLNAQTLVVAVSQSGQSAETVRLLELNHGTAPVIAVTNTPDSALAKQAAAVLLTRAGSEFSVSCKTYVSTLVVLKWLGDVLCRESEERSDRELRSSVELVSGYLSRWKNHVEELVSRLEGIDDLFVVGRGASLAAAGAGALITKESAHFHAEGMSSAAFRHGPFEMLSEKIFVAVLTGDDKVRSLNERLCTDVRGTGAQAELIGEDSSLPSFRLPRHDASVRPILEILPIQMVTIALAALAGREAGKFERATKITIVE
jgi:glucosamine--fructose-6-phosphate aminotransferase (isomerizing)